MGRMGSGLWKNIGKVWEELSSDTRFEMGDSCKLDSGMMYGVEIKP